MAYVALAKIKKNSVATTLSSGIADDATTIPVSELAYFHDADTTLITRGIVIGFDNANQMYAEEITITGASATSGAGNLTGASRGVNADGSIGAARAWDSGTEIAVMVSTEIYEIIKDNFAAHESGKAAAGANSDITSLSGLTTALSETQGGTGQTTITAGDLLYGDGANSLGKLAATGNGSKALVMNSGATAPEYKHAARTIILSGAGGYPAKTLPDAGFLTVEMTTNDVDVRGVKFAHSADALSYHVWAVPTPLNYDGSTMTAQFFWTTNTAEASGDIRWRIQMLSRADDEALDAAWGTAVGVTDTILAVNDQHISAATAAITPAGTPAGGEMMYFRVARDFENGDTSTADAILLAVRLAYGTDNYSDE